MVFKFLRVSAEIIVYSLLHNFVVVPYVFKKSLVKSLRK